MDSLHSAQIPPPGIYYTATASKSENSNASSTPSALSRNVTTSLGRLVNEPNEHNHTLGAFNPTPLVDRQAEFLETTSSSSSSSSASSRRFEKEAEDTDFISNSEEEWVIQSGDFEEDDADTQEPAQKRRRLADTTPSNGNPLEIVELVERILGYLPGKDIISSSKVNKFFYQIFRERLQYTVMLDIIRFNMVYSYGHRIIRNIYRNYSKKESVSLVNPQTGIDYEPAQNAEEGCTTEGIVADIDAQVLAVSLMRDDRLSLNIDGIPEADIQKILEQLIKEFHQEISDLPSEGLFHLGRILDNLDSNGYDDISSEDQTSILDFIYSSLYEDGPYQGEVRRFKNLFSYMLGPENVNIPDEDGVFPLMLFVKRGSIEILEFVLNIPGINVNIVDENDYRSTALHIAASTKTAEMVEILLKRNADINAQDRMGRTPLHRAILQGDSERRREVIRTLFNYNADTTIRDHLGNTALDLARQAGEEEMYLTLLRESNENK